METGERLAAYASGDLEPDERTALEAELARDAGLRVQLERIQRADAALADLPEVVPNPTFSTRLRNVVAAELDQQLDHRVPEEQPRGWRLPRWVPALGAAAAVVAVVAGGVATLGGGGDDDVSMDGDAGPEAAMMLDEDRGGDTAGAAPADGPLIVDTGRVVDEQDLAALAEDPRLSAMVDLQLSGLAAEELAQSYREQLSMAARVDEGAATVQSEATADDVDAAGTAVTACLDVLTTGADAPIVPLYAELASTPDGREVVVYAALGPGPSQAWDRIEVWLVDRDSCDVVQFLQHRP